MRRDPDGSIVLSRRNLLTLLSKIDDPTSERTLTAGRGGVNGSGGTLIVKAEPDDLHYANREAGGRVSAPSEAFIRHNKDRRL